GRCFGRRLRQHLIGGAGGAVADDGFYAASPTRRRGDAGGRRRSGVGQTTCFPTPPAIPPGHSRVFGTAARRSEVHAALAQLQGPGLSRLKAPPVAPVRPISTPNTPPESRRVRARHPTAAAYRRPRWRRSPASSGGGPAPSPHPALADSTPHWSRVSRSDTPSQKRRRRAHRLRP